MILPHCAYEGEAGYHLVPHSEVVVGGEEICRAIEAEVLRAFMQGLRVRGFTALMDGCLRGLRPPVADPFFCCG